MNTTHTYHVTGMDCAECARTVENGVRRLTGVHAVQVDFATGKLRIEGDVADASVRERLVQLGYDLADNQAAAFVPQQGGVQGFWNYLRSRHETRLALVGGGMILALILAQILGIPENITAVGYVAAMAVAAYPIARSGWNALRINHEFNINLLMTMAAVGAVLIGETLEAATVIFLFAVGEALEGYTADRARDSLRGLIALSPPTAVRLRPAVQSTNGFIALADLGKPARQEEIVSIEALRPGDTLLVRPGERIPMDGIITAGASSINQAAITGESLPVARTVNADVFAGTINGEGALEIRVTHLAADNTLSRIIRMVEEAQSVRAPSQRMIDRFARVYTPAVVVTAVLVALIPPLVFNAPFYNLADGTQGWLYRALELLVIACPCALVISAPVTVISAITRAARAGVLVKGGAHLEALAGVHTFAFDKTGTLTAGRPVVMQAHALDCVETDDCPRCDDVLALASAVERQSRHPLAQAVVNAAEARGLSSMYAPAESVEMLAGRGVQGRVNGRLVTVGSHRLFDDEHPHSAELCAEVSSAEAHGQTAMMLCDGDRVRGYITVADDVRADSREAVRELHALGAATVMLTGDNPAAAQAIGAKVGVRDVRAGLMPADKVNAVNGLMAGNQAVAMVGDGINDTPALAAATVGIAMGGAGSAQAMETADIVLMADDLKMLPFAVRLARFATALIRQNVALSLATKAVFVVLALTGGASLWLAILADVGMSLLVTLNGMRPLRFE